MSNEQIQDLLISGCSPRLFAAKETEFQQFCAERTRALEEREAAAVEMEAMLKQQACTQQADGQDREAKFAAKETKFQQFCAESTRALEEREAAAVEMEAMLKQQACTQQADGQDREAKFAAKETKFQQFCAERTRALEEREAAAVEMEAMLKQQACTQQADGQDREAKFAAKETKFQQFCAERTRALEEREAAAVEMEAMLKQQACTQQADGQDREAKFAAKETKFQQFCAERTRALEEREAAAVEMEAMLKQQAHTQQADGQDREAKFAAKETKFQQFCAECTRALEEREAAAVEMEAMLKQQACTQQADGQDREAKFAAKETKFQQFCAERTRALEEREAAAVEMEAMLKQQACTQQADGTGTQFASLATDTSKVVPHKPPRVGLENFTNICYFNSFVQALFLTDAFVWRIYSFSLKLKENPSTIDKEDFEFNKKVVKLLQKQFAKMALTRHKCTDLKDILQAFPASYRSGEQQDVTETIRFVFSHLGGADQALLGEVFGGEKEENIQCRKCGNIKVSKEKFTDLVVPVPTAKEAQDCGSVPTVQQLLENLLKAEEMDANNKVMCEKCLEDTPALRWTKISTWPSHMCLCLNRWTLDTDTLEFRKEKTPVKVDAEVSIGGYTYEPYHAIIHEGEDDWRGHYYGVGKRAESQTGWYVMNDANVKKAGADSLGVLGGRPSAWHRSHTTYVLFLRRRQSPPTPEYRIPLPLFESVTKEDKKQWGGFLFHSLRSFIFE